MIGKRQKTRLVAVVGPSGVGKDSVMQKLAEDPGVSLARRVITRPSEAGGEDFDGVSPTDFERQLQAGAFALHWQAHGLSYGVPAAITRELDAGKIVLVNLSRSVLLQAQDIFPSLAVISLTASAETLAGRLAARGRETAQDQARRLSRRDIDLPEGLHNVITIDNSGALDDTVQAVWAALQPESV